MKKLIAIVIISLTIWFIFKKFNFHPIDTKFGKQYNKVRLEYGSPIIHDYLVLEYTEESYECWGIPKEIHDTIRMGFHEGKCFYINPDSILQEDDIFRKRINDTTFAFIGILTFGNSKEHEFSSIYYDTVDARYLKLSGFEYLERGKDYPHYNNKRKLTIEEADSILNSWGTSRIK